METTELIKTLGKLTDDNHHNDALILIANHYGWTICEGIFQHIKAIVAIEGYLPMALKMYRDETYKTMMQCVENRDPENYESIRMAL